MLPNEKGLCTYCFAAHATHHTQSMHNDFLNVIGHLTYFRSAFAALLLRSILRGLIIFFHAFAQQHSVYCIDSFDILSLIFILMTSRQLSSLKLRVNVVADLECW